MTVKFNVKLSSEDMYRFNMYHAYTSMQGILSLVMGIFVIVYYQHLAKEKQPLLYPG